VAQASGIGCNSLSHVCESFDEEPNTALAVDRLAGFRFVGLTEHWELSMCLFVRMTGTQCRQNFFENTRQSTPSNATARAEPFDSQFYDDDDQRVYEAARVRFWSDVRRYDVSAETCKSACPGWQYSRYHDMALPMDTGAIIGPDAQMKARASLDNEILAETQNTGRLPVSGCDPTLERSSVCLRYWTSLSSRGASAKLLEEQSETPLSVDGKTLHRVGVQAETTTPAHRAARCRAGGALVVQCFGACGNASEGKDPRASGYPTHFSHILRNWLPRALYCRELEAATCTNLFVPSELHALYAGAASMLNMSLVGENALTGNRSQHVVTCTHQPDKVSSFPHDQQPLYAYYYREYRRFRDFAPRCTSADVFMVQRFDSGANRRFIANANETAQAVSQLALAANLSFDSGSFEGLSLAEQQRRVCSTKLLVGQHGSGIGHALWTNQPGSAVLELPPALPYWWESILWPGRGVQKLFASHAHTIGKNKLSDGTSADVLTTNLTQLELDFSLALQLVDRTPSPSVLPPLIVTGFAGSGTRIVALAVQQLGFQIGGNANMDASLNATLGTDVIMSLLACMGSTTAYAHHAPCAHLVRDARRKLQQGIDIYTRTFAIDVTRPWALKSPRFLFLLPLLASLYPKRLRVVTMVRDGRDIALDDTPQAYDMYMTLFPRFAALQHKEACEQLLPPGLSSNDSCGSSQGRSVLQRVALWQHTMESAWTYMREDALSMPNFVVAHFIRLEDVSSTDTAAPAFAAMAGAVGCPAASNPFLCADVVHAAAANITSLGDQGHHGAAGTGGPVDIHRFQREATDTLLGAIESVGARSLQAWGYIT
jgi:hypothetical protein